VDDGKERLSHRRIDGTNFCIIDTFDDSIRISRQLVQLGRILPLFFKHLPGGELVGIDVIGGYGSVPEVSIEVVFQYGRRKEHQDTDGNADREKPDEPGRYKGFCHRYCDSRKESQTRQGIEDDKQRVGCGGRIDILVKLRREQCNAENQQRE